MLSSSPELSVEFPSALDDLKFEGIRILKGGTHLTTALVKRPLPAIKDNKEGQALLSIWDAWWRTTLYGKDPATLNPRWSSISRTGEIWNQFKEAANLETGQPQVYCVNCGVILQHPTARGIGTKHLLNHQKSQSCALTTTPIHDYPAQPTVVSKRPRKDRPIVYTQQTFEKQLVDLVVDHSWSFRTIERPSFHQFVRLLRPEAVIISRYKFGQIFEDQFATAQSNLLQDLGNNTKISIALDAWTGSNHYGFLAIKCYYITNKWELKEKLLDFLPMRGQHTGASMAKEVLKVLKLTSTLKRLLAVTCDNASNNGTLSRFLKSGLEEEGWIWNATENTIPCLAHIINLVVQDIIFYLRLSASQEDKLSRSFQRRHVQNIKNQISVPNSLRKVCL